ncbi:MATE family efflux transporter [Pantanalinema rosaneae CENA516]|uniref:MATE family efflux transporter n=1 Tax=Pantanalinema rosaneae TaxID=1620701 RepID=UPI003D6F9339
MKHLPAKSRLLTEVRESLILALPLAGAQLAQSATGFVDTVMMGILGSATIAAGGLGAITFNGLVLVTSAILSAVSPLVAEAYGSGNRHRAAQVTRQGLWLAVIMTIPLMVILWNGNALLQGLGQAPATARLAESYLRSIVWGCFPALAFAVLRSFVSALSQPRPIMVIVVGGTLLNIGGNYVLIFGKFGLPALGLAGIGWASTLSLWSMFLALTGYMVWNSTLRSYRVFHQLFRFQGKLMRELLRVGLPIGGLVMVEAGLFTITTFLMGQLGTVTLAAHQVALQTAAITFTGALGVSFATTVRVGQLGGQGDTRGMRLAGLVGIGLGGAFMALMGILFWAIPDRIVALYLDVHDPANQAVISLAKQLLGVAAVFQIVDGLQVTAAGALRGLKDTRLPMLIGFVAYWCVGLTIGYLLGIRFGFAGVGLWWGLAIGLMVAAVVLTLRFLHLSDRLIQAADSTANLTP